MSEGGVGRPLDSAYRIMKTDRARKATCSSWHTQAS